MLVIISPARNTRIYKTEGIKTTRPLFLDQTMRLVGLLREYQPWQLESLLDVPPKRAFDLYDAYAAFSPNAAGCPALLAYYGAAYRNMCPQKFGADELSFAQRHLRIFSALYGLLRPLDGIQEHRLGLKKDFSPYGKDLYAFWGSSIYKELYKQDDLIVNLSSLEYAKLVLPHMQPGQRMLTCRFLLDKPGGPKGTVSTVRAARGLMARFIVQNGIKNPQDLQQFEEDGYRFMPSMSHKLDYVFVKPRRGFIV